MLLSKNHQTKSFPLGLDGLVANRSCWLHDIIVRSTGALERNVTIYNGLDDTAPIVFQFSVLLTGTIHLPFKYPVFFDKGIYYKTSTGLVYGSFRYEYAEDSLVSISLLVSSIQTEVQCILREMEKWFTQYPSLLKKTQPKQTLIGQLSRLLKGWFIR